MPLRQNTAVQFKLLKLIIATRLRVVPQRLQNSLYFCVFKYTQAVKQKVWNEAENKKTVHIFAYSSTPFFLGDCVE